jgi:hypothetical protein
MNSNKYATGFLITTLLFGLSSGVFCSFLLVSAVGFENTWNTIMRIAGNLTLMWVNALLELLTGLGVAVLSILFFIAIQIQDLIIVLAALGWRLAEALLQLVSKAGIFALILLGMEFI